jgi:hypothetical protein
MSELRFRVYPEGRGLHLDVIIWPTLTSMRRHLVASYPRRGMSKVLAVVLWPTDPADRPRRGHIAEMHFNRRYLASDIIAHEATHAALAWARRAGISISESDGTIDASPDEERFCYALGSITLQISEKAFAPLRPT